MLRSQILKIAGVIFLVFGLQLFYGLQSYAQQADLSPLAAAKAAAGQEALSHRGLEASSPVGTSNAIGTFITYDFPDSVDGTFPSSINATGAITGYYCNAITCLNYFGLGVGAHGFVRDSHGAFTTFDAPGAVNGTYPYSINGADAVTGYYCGAITCPAFLRDTNGALTSFDTPDDVNGIQPFSINSAKAITGVYYDANLVAHGFLRAGDGTITTFDVPGASTTSFLKGTIPEAIDTEGLITGIYTDVNNATHVFLRSGDGTFTTFDAPGNIDPFFLFNFPPISLYTNTKGVITGSYFEPISGNPFGGNYRVFVRALDGTFTTFDAATYSPCCIWSWPSGINPAGTITGALNDGFGVDRGFLRTSHGSLTTFHVPGGTGGSTETVPLGIDSAGEIMGYYLDASSVRHGFLLTPNP